MNFIGGLFFNNQNYAQYISPGSSSMTAFLRTSTALERPSSVDMRASSCSMEMT